MTTAAIDPLAEIPPSPLVAALPKADRHLHLEAQVRHDRVATARHGRTPYDWRARERHLVSGAPPGTTRHDRIYQPAAVLARGGIPDAEPESVIARIVDILDEDAADGALLIEVRFGPTGRAVLQPDFMATFREAERRVQSRQSLLRAESSGYLSAINDPERLAIEHRRLKGYLLMAREELAGVDFRADPYESEADPVLWSVAQAGRRGPPRRGSGSPPTRASSQPRTLH